MPIFVAHDSADVWAHPELFFLDAHGRPTAVAGVPPDYFSATGQRWGNPLYRWNVMARQRFRWWIARLEAAFALVDVLRIDHFIGFTRYWEIPAAATTAVEGRWVPGPGLRLLRALERALGPLAIVAEDLGTVTPEVEALRDKLALPGMKVLHFAFDGDPANPHLPHTWPANAVAYTGTHDNDTSAGWFAAASADERARVQRYCARNGDEVSWDLIRLALASVADTAIVPAQDVLALGSEARMNVPGRADGNWTWRLREGALGDWHRARLRELVEVYGRGR
jgi:4-alpha-glucanotransferase